VGAYEILFDPAAHFWRKVISRWGQPLMVLCPAFSLIGWIDFNNSEAHAGWYFEV